MIHMRFPLTRYGWPQVLVYPAAVLAAMLAVVLLAERFPSAWLFLAAEALLTVILVFLLAFFRDPDRRCPGDSRLVLAPADGRVTDIDTVPERDFIEGNALRIGIFLSIFNAHINRAPCSVRVDKITYKKGMYRNALNPQSARVNESNDIGMIRTDTPEDRLIVRQISGAIARRIVCEAAQGQELTAGQRFGMIKFGSRTELYVPAGDNTICLAKIGDKVKAGLTPLVRYR